MPSRLRSALAVKRLPVAAFLILLSLFLQASSPVHADQGKVSFSISPVIFEFANNPGETRTDVVKVTNNSDGPQSITMDIEAFTGTETGEAEILDNEDPAYSLKDWLTFSPKNFTLATGETKVVNFTITVPKGAEPGGRYGSILVTNPQTQLKDSTGATTVQRVGALVLLSVRGPIAYSANVKNFGSSQRLYEHAPVTFTTRIHNNSTVHIKPQGFVTISNAFGHKVADVAVPQHNILPKSDRLLDITYDKKLPIGKYTATLLVTYGEPTTQLTATTTFIVFPWKTGIPIVLVTIIVLGFIIIRRRNIGEALRIIFGKK